MIGVAAKPRNKLKLIAQVFYDLGLIERYGKGIRRILDDCREGGSGNGLAREPIAMAILSHVVPDGQRLTSAGFRFPNHEP